MAKYDIGPKIGIEGEVEFRRAIENINRTLKTLGTEMKAATSAYKEGDKSAAALTAQNEVLNKQIAEQKEKLLSLTTGLEKSNAKYGEADKVTQGWKQSVNVATAELNNLERQLKENTTAIDAGTSAAKKYEDQMTRFKNIGKSLTAVGKTMSIAVTAPIVAGMAASAKAAIDFESAFAGVRKTVDATEEQFFELSEGIREMSKRMPQSAVDIAKIAEAAGQLGIKTESILTFAETMLMLGDATNMSSEEAATSLARFANIMQMPQNEFERLGSVIVDLGNNMATTEAEIVAMAMRLAGAGKQVGMSEAKIMALAAALSSVGIEAEAGGSAMSKVMASMQLAVEKGGQPLKDFSRVAGMSAASFAKAYREDAAGALIAFIAGLNDTSRLGGSAIAVLDDMGISEIRMRDALLRAAGASEIFTDAISIGSDAWKENAALTEEAEKRYKTVESQLGMLKNTAIDAAIGLGDILLPVIIPMIEGLRDMINTFSELPEPIQGTVLVVGGLLAAIGPVLLIGGQVLTLVGTISGALALMHGSTVIVTPAIAGLATVMKFFTGGTIAATAATTAHTVATTAGTVATKIATVAQGLFNAVMTVNPIMLVVGGLVALGAALYVVIKHWKEIVGWLKEAWEWLNKWNAIDVKDKAVINNPRLTGYASGTKNALPGWHWVGEEGPELINFKGGEAVMSAGRSAQATTAPSAISTQSGANQTHQYVLNITLRTEAREIARDVFQFIEERNNLVGQNLLQEG